MLPVLAYTPEVLLEPELGFVLVKHLYDGFGYAFGIGHYLVVVRKVLSPSVHKFGQCPED